VEHSPALYAICNCMASTGDIICLCEFVLSRSENRGRTAFGFIPCKPLSMELNKECYLMLFEQACRHIHQSDLSGTRPWITRHTATMSLLRRPANRAIADEYDMHIIERWFPISPLQTDPVKALVDLAADRTWYIAHAVQVYNPALRLAIVNCSQQFKGLGLYQCLKCY